MLILPDGRLEPHRRLAAAGNRLQGRHRAGAEKRGRSLAPRSWLYKRCFNGFPERVAPHPDRFRLSTISVDNSVGKLSKSGVQARELGVSL